MNHYILIWSVCTFVETRVQEEINLEELALQTGFSLAHVRDIFRQNTGKSLSHYIQERKIANAAIIIKIICMIRFEILFFVFPPIKIFLLSSIFCISLTYSP